MCVSQNAHQFTSKLLSTRISAGWLLFALQMNAMFYKFVKLLTLSNWIVFTRMTLGARILQDQMQADEFNISLNNPHTTALAQQQLTVNIDELNIHIVPHRIATTHNMLTVPLENASFIVLCQQTSTSSSISTSRSVTTSIIRTTIASASYSFGTAAGTQSSASSLSTAHSAISLNLDSRTATSTLTTKNFSKTYISSETLSTSNFAISTNSVEYFALKGKGITYSPYLSTGGCKAESDISSDMQKLLSFELIRVYAPDCNCISIILSTLRSTQKLLIGLFYMDTIASDIDLMVNQINGTANGWGSVYAVSVGNEWINSGQYNLSNVTTAIDLARTLLNKNGWFGPIVTVDTLPAYQNNPALCQYSDLVTVNAHPYWDGNISPNSSGTFLESVIEELTSLCNGKAVLITETGWPTRGLQYGNLGVPGTKQQLQAIESISESVADKVIFFTLFNDLWKDPGPFEVEQYWGIF